MVTWGVRTNEQNWFLIFNKVTVLNGALNIKPAVLQMFFVIVLFELHWMGDKDCSFTY
jgi:hypothetical protein